jgi:ADP-ribose pyrophosphatase YjhB (NUDIX family)
MFVAVHLFLLKGDKILLLKRYNTGFMDGKYSVVAGHVDSGETYVEAMKREAKEEAGIVITERDLKPVQVMHRNSDTERIDYFFVSEKWDGEIRNMEPTKCDDLSWFPINELPNNMIPYVRHAIEMYKKDEHFTEYGWT